MFAFLSNALCELTNHNSPGHFMLPQRFHDCILANSLPATELKKNNISMNLNTSVNKPLR